MFLGILIGVVFLACLFAGCGFYDWLMKKHDKELKDMDKELYDL
jgi:hypothetical protein